MFPGYDEYIVEDSVRFIIGDKVFVASGPLKGRESIICITILFKLRKFRRRIL
jgi:hypothetical protein